MNVDFKGYLDKVITFECDSTVTQSGTAVKMAGNGTVSAATDGEAFIGVAADVRDGFATVQTTGAVEMKKSGTVAVGFQKLVSGGSGIVKVNTTSGKEYIVLSVDDNTATFIL